MQPYHNLKEHRRERMLNKGRGKGRIALLCVRCFTSLTPCTRGENIQAKIIRLSWMYGACKSSTIRVFSAFCNKINYSHISTDVIVFTLCIGTCEEKLYFCNYISVCSSLCKEKFLKLFLGVIFSLGSLLHLFAVM